MSNPHKREPEPPSLRRRVVPAGAIAGGAALVLVGGLVVWGLRQRPASADVARPPVAPAAGAAAVGDLALLAADRALTEDELRAFRQNLDRAPSEDATRRRELETLYAAAERRSLSERTQAAEQRARADLAAGRKKEAVAALREARELQRRLNQQVASAVGRDLARETALDFEIERLESEPLAAELAQATAEAERWREAGRVPEALAAFQRAHELQLRLNREFGRTPAASIRNLERLQTEIASAASAPLLAELMAATAQAADAQARGDSDAAVVQFEHAAAVQRRINDEYPRSRDVSSERLDTLEIARQTELSARPVQHVAELDRRIAAALRAHEWDKAAALLQEGAGVLDALFARLPRSRRLDPELRAKFSYLVLRRDDFGRVSELVEAALQPLPGGGARLLGGEVPQELYERVMRSNPSRQPAAALPVESVSLAEAEDFCRRLSWLLGRPVRLPTLAEYRAALGPVPAGAALAAQTWSQERSDGRARPVGTSAANPAGFRDLLGNVAEWLAPAEPASPRALAAGGSYADPEAVLAGVPVVELGRNDRARTIGFRVVVE